MIDKNTPIEASGDTDRLKVFDKNTPIDANSSQSDSGSEAGESVPDENMPTDSFAEEPSTDLALDKNTPIE